MCENETEGDHFDDEADLAAPLGRLAPPDAEGTWTNSEKSLVKGAYNSVSAAYQLLLDWGKSARGVLGDNDEAFRALTGTLGAHYERTVRQSADLLAEFFLEASTRGPHHQHNVLLRREAVDVLSGCIQAFAACAEFGTKALSDQGNQCLAGALGVLPDSPLFGVWMRFLAVTPVAVEIAELARQGFADAVSTRARSLHETAVVAMVVAKYAKQPELKIVDRFWEYQYIRQYKGFLRADKHISTMKQRDADLAVDMDENDETWQQALREAKKEHDRVIRCYGSEFAKDYGWARNLTDKRLTISELEVLAGGVLNSLDYMLASTRVHPSYVLDLELVSVLRDSLRHANSAWLHLVHAALSLLEEDYLTPEPHLHRETAFALFDRTERALDDADEWIREKRDEFDRLTGAGEEAVKKHIAALRDSR